MKARVFALLVIYYQKIRNNTSSRLVQFVILNLVLTLYNVIAPILKLDQINERVPLFYYMPWGNLQLVPKNYIFLVPSINLVLIGTGVLLYFVAKKYQFQYLDMLSIFTSSISNVLLTLSLYRSIYISSTPESISAGSAAIQFISPFFIALGLAYLLTPKFISVLTERGVVTNPLLHRHPGMLLAKPSARGGGFIFYLVFLAVSVVTVGFTKELTGIYLVAGILATLGLLDDFQNTNAKSRLKFIENPVLRLALLYITSYLFILFGISIKYIGNPAGGIFDFNSFSIVINNTPVFFLSVTITLLWVVWVLNLLSWSNGIDAQYGGMVGIALVVISILALRFGSTDIAALNYSKIALIAAGAAFGITFYTWHPSKIMWGFGAMSVGSIIAALSILIGSKIAVSMLVVLLPFIDSAVTIIRRILNGQNPLKSDRKHLHHLLLDRGWSIKKTALFYWATTAVFGILGLITADKNMALVIISIGGTLAFIIASLNISAHRKARK